MKNNIRFATVLLAVVLAISCKKENLADSTALTASNEEDMYTETAPTVQTAVCHNVDANIGGYLEALPAHYKDHPNKRYPLIIFLHGQGELGNGTTADLNKVSDNAIPELIANQTFPSNFRVHNFNYQFIVLSPQFKNWPQVSDINDMFDFANRKYRIDYTRLYICGLSMGGGAAWDYTWTHGKRITAVVPISGASWPTTEKAQAIASDTVAVWAFHNNDDPTVPSWYSIDYVDYINGYNPYIPAKLTLWPTGGHDAWTKATDPNYKENGRNIYEWMLCYQKKKDNHS